MRAIYLLIVLTLFVPIAMPLSDAGECEYGTVRAWARTLDENGEWGQWQNATVHTKLKVHEPFQVKIEVTAKTDCNHLYVSLEKTGNTKSYEVVNGPSKIMGYVRNHNVSAGWSRTYEWTVRPTGNWTEGIAALNVEAYFYKVYKIGDYYDGDGKTVDFTVIAAYISPQEWQGANVNDMDDNRVSGFTGAAVAISLIFSIIFKMGKKI